MRSTRRSIQLTQRFGTFNRTDLRVLAEALGRPVPGYPAGTMPTRQAELYKALQAALTNHLADQEQSS
jgi:hypothetical protein